ncbi:MAG: class I SAM-dependent methyltransferase [Anaerolineae bacterium]|nr:class I SAM-dependent methyltransferase [Anaerolineae bacterium]
MDAAFWEDAWRSDADSVMVTERVLQGELESLRPGSALDLGCGNGANTLMLDGAGWRVTGVDCSARAIALARQAAQARGLDARFICNDFSQWQADTRFDLVISTYALPGGAAGQRVLRMAAQALAAGGTLLVAEWDRSMSEVWGVAAVEFTTVTALATAVPDLVVEKAELRSIPDMFVDPAHPRDSHGSLARVAFLRARKP